VEKQIKRVLEDPFIPIYWGKNQKGMTANEELDSVAQRMATMMWRYASTAMVGIVWSLVALGVHKQIANRLLEPWMWQTVIVTATEWQNFFNLRTDSNAQPEIQKIACMMRDEYYQSIPTQLEYGQWHMPLVTQEEMQAEPNLPWNLICVGRCARVSYLTHDGIRDPSADIKLAGELLKNGHMSPFEHVARPVASDGYIGNLRGWEQYRKTITGEAVWVKGAKCTSSST
jgi:hypothetical protein